MLARIIKNLTFSTALIGLVGMLTGVGLIIISQKSLAIFCLIDGTVLFTVSLLVARYFHNRNIHLETWGFILGLVILFVLEFIFSPFFFAFGVTVSTLVIIFVYAFIARKIYKMKQKKEAK